MYSDTNLQFNSQLNSHHTSISLPTRQSISSSNFHFTMKNLRRSLNKDKISGPTNFHSVNSSNPIAPTSFSNNSPYPNGIPLPSKSPPIPNSNNIGIPKRVIKALRPYRARTPEELNFEQGDFFHVLGEVRRDFMGGNGGEDSSNLWFDADNPITGVRGLVPQSYFQVLGRNIKDTERLNNNPVSSGNGIGIGSATMNGTLKRQQSQTSLSSSKSNLKSQPPPLPYSHSHTQSFHHNQSQLPTSPPPKSPPPTHHPLYGIVIYDFIAERTDELGAQKGEPLIIIAQSNHEWFVAKPIGRLGGPGLIPVAFVEIQDHVTGRKMAKETVEELLRTGGVLPKVEEWKEKAAEYRSKSIPLGRFEFSSGAGGGGEGEGRDRLEGGSFQVDQQIGYGQGDGGVGHEYETGGVEQGYDQPSSGSSITEEVNDQNPEAQVHFSLLVFGRVESFHSEEGIFWFHLRIKFLSGRQLILYRSYEDFYEFHNSLLGNFPYEAGQQRDEDGNFGKRIIPGLPGPVEKVDEEVCLRRTEDLNIYFDELVRLPEWMRRDEIFKEFLEVRWGDRVLEEGRAENDPDAIESFGSRQEQGGRGEEGEVVEYLDRMGGDGGMGELRDGMEMMNVRGSQGSQHALQQQQQQQHHQSGGRFSNNSASGSSGRVVSKKSSKSTLNSAGGYGFDYLSQPPANSSPSLPSSRLSPPPSVPTALSPASPNNNSAPPFLKIKIFHRSTDDLIAIRVPPNITYNALVDKVRERLGNEISKIRFKEGEGVVGATGGRLISIENDRELDGWVRSGGKMQLYAE